MPLLSFLSAHGKALGSFGAMHAMQLILPLLALPWLARVLGPDAFGILMYICLLPPLVALFMDWGLTLGGSREAAKLRVKHEEFGALLGSVLSAKAILAIVCVLFCACLIPFLPYGTRHAGAYALAVATGVARGMNPAWFFQGAGFGLPRMAAYDVAASAISLSLVILYIRQASQWPLYLLFIAACKGAAYGWITFGLVRQYRPRLALGSGYAILRKTAALFGSAFSLMLCYNGGQIVLGFFLPSADMGIIAAVMKMLRALASLIMPFTQTLFPEICIWRCQEPGRTRHILRLSLGLTALGACITAACAALMAPWLIGVALGKDYSSAVQVLRLTLLAVPLMACNNVLSFQALVPFGQEKAQLAVQTGCACISFPLAAVLGYLGGIAGGALLPVSCEFLMLSGFLAAVRHRCPEAFFSQLNLSRKR